MINDSVSLLVTDLFRLFFFLHALLLLGCLFQIISSFFSSFTCLLAVNCLSVALLGPRCVSQAFSSCGAWGLLFVSVCGLLVAGVLSSRSTGCKRLGSGSCGGWAPCLQGAGPGARRLSSCGARAQLLLSVWNLPGPGVKSMFSALAGGFTTTGAPRMSWHLIVESSFLWSSCLCSIGCSILLFRF